MRRKLRGVVAPQKAPTSSGALFAIKHRVYTVATLWLPANGVAKYFHCGYTVAHEAQKTEATTERGYHPHPRHRRPKAAAQRARRAGGPGRIGVVAGAWNA